MLALTLAERLGRRLMSDFGFGSLVAKYEEYFGKRIVRWMLMLVGLATAAVCMGAIWEWLVSPILAFLNSPERTRTLTRIILIVAGIVVGTSFGSVIVNHFSHRRQLKEGRKMLADMRKESDEIIADAHAIRDEAAQTLAEAGDMQKQTLALFEAAKLVSGELKKVSTAKSAKRPKRDHSLG